MSRGCGLVWFRRDLRLHDNAALALALQHCSQVHLVFVFDTDILQALAPQDRRVSFIRDSADQLDQAVRAHAGNEGAGLICVHARAVHAIPRLALALGVDAVFAARDYEPAARERDEQITRTLRAQGQRLCLVKDHVLLEERELLTRAAQPFTVFTPYYRAWLARLQANPALVHCHPSDATAHGLAPRPADLRRPVPSVAALGFTACTMPDLLPGCVGAERGLQDFLQRIDRYHALRDFPALKATSLLGVHLRFGTVSIRQLAHLALQRPHSDGARVWLSELAWRDFYFQILANYPHVATGAFKSAYDALVWETGAKAQEAFAHWCDGTTGYPLVDAAMRQLKHTGALHNRLRMVVASFLVKDLGIDWRWGERHFAQHLNDFDLAANNGGWQWVASSGCDAQPYFRIFNPVTQSQRFDADGAFIGRTLGVLQALPAPWIHAPWTAPPDVLERAGLRLGVDYPLPIVDHAQARKTTLLRYARVRALGGDKPPS